MSIGTIGNSNLNVNEILQKILRYLRKNPGTAFIIAFQASLVLAATELINGNESAANDAGVYAFILLVIGVAFYAVSVIKARKEA